MITTELAGLRLPLPQLVLGTMTFGDTADADASGAMLEAALAGGITHVDTANGYAGTRTEQILGDLLRGRWEQITLATKVGLYRGDAPDLPALSAEGIRVSFEASLRRLQTDRVDVLYLHAPDRSVPLEETAGALAALVDEGLVDAIGVSNFSAWQVQDVITACERAGAPRPVVAQQLYNLIARRLESEYAEFAATHGLATMVYNPLGGGLLTGRHQFDDSPGEGRFGSSSLATMYRDRYWSKALFDAVAALQRIAGEAGIGLPELALRWLLSRPVVTSVLLGGSKPAQLEENLAAASRGALPEEVLAACDEVGTALHGPMPAYSR